jgi:dihydrofolate synthase/folylpolyglutamate synthase
MKEIKKQAAAMKAPLLVTGKDIDFSYRFESSREFGPHTRICLTTPTSKFEHLRCSAARRTSGDELRFGNRNA